MVRRAGALGFLCLVLLSCTGDGDGDETMSKSDYVSQADEICTEFMEAGIALGSPSSPEDLVDYFDEAILQAERAATDLSALNPPGEAEAVHDALLTSLTESTDKVREARAAAADGDMDRVGAAMEDATQIGARADADAKEFGFEVCGSESEIRDRERADQAAAFCDPFVRIATSGALTPERLSPLLDELVAAAPAEITVQVHRWAELARGVNDGFAEAGATPDNPKSIDEVRSFLSDDEIAYLEETASANQTGTLPDGIVGEVLGYAAENCDMN